MTKLKLIILISVFLTSGAQLLAQDSSDPFMQVANARQLLHNGNKNGAEAIFASLMEDKKNKKNTGLLIAMSEAVIEEKEGNANEALSWLEMAKKKDKHNATIDILEGQAYKKLGDASRAYTAYNEAIKKDPRNVKAYYLLGKIFIGHNNPDVYMEQFMKAYAIDSNYAPVLDALYDHYYYRDAKLAKRYLEKYIANTPYSLENEYRLTDITFLNGEYSKAITMAQKLMEKEKDKVQPRLYKLIAYAYARSGDTMHAQSFMKDYFDRQEPSKTIAADFQFMGQLSEKIPGQETAVIKYYEIATDMDTVQPNKAEYASAIAALYGKEENYALQAEWLGKYYQWKEKPTNIDLFNWGLANYKASDFKATDSVFGIYTERYPEDIFGYYWRAQAAAAIDTTMKDSLAVPHYLKVIELGEKDKVAHKKMLLKAYGYMGGFEANITKNYPLSLEYFEKYTALEENEDVTRYIETLRKWIDEKSGIE